jgi:phosphoribosylformylglycinamidine synthase
VQSEKTPDGEYKLAQLVRANEALYDITTTYKIPCISGKDSMKNDYNIGGQKISIPPTVLFSAMGIAPDVRLCVTSDFKQPGDIIYILGLTRDELGASEYYASLGFVGANVPKVLDSKQAIEMYRALHQRIRDQLVASCHDLSDGGLGVALAESCFAGGLGADIDLSAVPADNINRNDTILFSETPCRFIISVSPENKEAFESRLSNSTLSAIGETNSSRRLTVKGLDGSIIINNQIDEMKSSWQSPLGT